MKEQIDLLIELQSIDLQQESLRQQVDLKREKVENDEMLLEDLTQTLSDQRNQLNETKKLYSLKSQELEEMKVHHHNAKNKFGGVTNFRDYAAAEKEVENFKKMLSQLDEELSQLSNAISEAEESIKREEEDFERLQNEIEAERESVTEAELAISSEVIQLGELSKALSKKLSPQVLGRYRLIRSKKPGEAVVLAREGTCMGCHMRLPPQSYIQLQKQTSLECCQNCQRILYFDEVLSRNGEVHS